MEKIILVNTVETSSQASSSEINEYGQVVKIAITDGQQVLFCPVVLAEVGERGKGRQWLLKSRETLTVGVAPQVEHLPSSAYDWGKGMKKHAFIDFCKKSTVQERICERSLWQVVQTFKRSL